MCAAHCCWLALVFESLLHWKTFFNCVSCSSRINTIRLMLHKYLLFLNHAETLELFLMSQRGISEDFWHFRSKLHTTNRFLFTSISFAECMPWKLRAPCDKDGRTNHGKMLKRMTHQLAVIHGCFKASFTVIRAVVSTCKCCYVTFLKRKWLRLAPTVKSLCTQSLASELMWSQR